VTERGVSLVICCHNSASRLPATLDHLARQEVDPSISWEVIVVDNLSTDDTASVAHRSWTAGNRALLRVVAESRLGLSYARTRGIANARYDIITFVDDDNWLCPGWVETVHRVMAEHPEVGALGGINEPVFETDRPVWFGPVAWMYAIGPEGEPSGDVTGIHMPCGAGLTMRRVALADIKSKGMRAMSADRTGSGLGGGGDVELTYFLRLAGWRLWIDPRLRLKHFLPAPRLNWTYARRLAHGLAFSTPESDALIYACKPPRTGLTLMLRVLRERWVWQTGTALTRLVPAWRGVGKRAFGLGEAGDHDVLRAERLFGRLAGLLAARRWYDGRAREIRAVMARSRRQEGARG
jgi:glycosyltransferase involved in cell wall biosynthesis